MRESAGERVPGWRAGCMRGTDAQRVDSLRPVVLIVKTRDHNLRDAGERGRGRRSGATVVHDGGNPREKRMHVGLTNREAILFVLNK